jgi:hypothetical protein
MHRLFPCQSDPSRVDWLQAVVVSSFGLLIIAAAVAEFVSLIGIAR